MFRHSKCTVGTYQFGCFDLCSLLHPLEREHGDVTLVQAFPVIFGRRVLAFFSKHNSCGKSNYVVVSPCLHLYSLTVFCLQF